MWRRAMLVLAVAMAVAFATPAYATVVEHGTFTSEEHFGPMVINDMPCLEGKEFVETGAEFIRGRSRRTVRDRRTLNAAIPTSPYSIPVPSVACSRSRT